MLCDALAPSQWWRQLLPPRYWSVVKKHSSKGAKLKSHHLDVRQSCNRKRYGIVCFKLQLLGLYSVPSLDRHFSQNHTVLFRRGARGQVCRTDTPEYLLSDYYGHRCGGSQWLDQERRVFTCLFMSFAGGHPMYRRQGRFHIRAAPRAAPKTMSSTHVSYLLKMLLVSTTLILDQFSQTDFSRRASPPCQGSW